MTLDPHSVDDKCKTALPELTIRKIKRNVTDYYPYVKREFRAWNRSIRPSRS